MEILMTVAGNAAQQVVDYTLAPIARQVGYLIFYKGNFKDLEDQVKGLNRVKESIENKVREERRNGREIEDIDQNWLNKVDEITKAAKQLSDDPRRNNAGCTKWSCPNLKSRHQLSRKAKKMATNVVEVMQEKPLNVVGYLPPLDVVGSTSATSSEKLESRNLMKQEIVLALRDPKISRIGVYGLGGVGKTTLVKEVAKQVKDNKLFDEVVIVNISEDLDLGKIQDELADFLGLHFQEMSIVGRAKRLCQRIKQEKSILIILDNVQAILDLEKLGIPLENNHEGCKLLLTSRNQDILEKMEIHKDFGLNVLNPEETWSLFQDMVGDALIDASLHSIAIQVAEKCAGLTVLIVTVAKALKKRKDIKSWEDALKQLQTVDKHGMTEKIYSALEFSYNHLEEDEVKALFLLCGVIFDPDVDYLLKYGMGLGIMKNINTVNDARLRLHELLGSLQASFLLLEVNRKGKVNMHDTVREVAVSIASRDQHVFKVGRETDLKKWPPENFPQGCRQIILEWCHIHKLPERLECPNVEFFCLSNVNRSLNIPDSFFEGMRNLKVLDLTCMHLSSLPKSFYSLTDLQTLCLDHCALGDMTNVGALKNLQTLSLNGSSIIRLPSELRQLTLLRMLDLTNAGIEIFPSNIISKLTNLEELYIGNTSIKWEPENSVAENKKATLSELRHLTKLTALEIQIQGALVLPRDIMFENLERYKILIGDVWEWSNDYGASKMLKLKLHTSIHLEHGIKELIKVVEDLYLDEINGISNVLFHLNGEGFPLLKHLHIQNNVQIQHIIDSRESNQTDDAFFPNLETLVLQNLSKLEKLCHGGPVTMNSFANLRCIKVKGCDQLEYLFSISMVKDLSRLLEVEISECSSMKKIVFVESSFPNSTTIDNVEFNLLRSLTLRHLPAIDDFYCSELTSSITSKQSLCGSNVPTSFFNAKVKFSNLETLKLSSINLNKIWDDNHLSIDDSFHNLANLSVENCSGLKYLFTSSMIGSFLKLKQLEINKCDMMEEIISIRGEKGATKEVRLSKLETMVINNMKSLKKVWHFQFDGLKTLEVKNCEKLENIFTSDMQRTFGSLETLKVSDCGSMEEIFQLTANEVGNEEEDNVTQVTQLKKLHLLGLPELKQIWSKDPRGIMRFCHLQDVKVENCIKLEYLFPFSIATDLLQLEKLFLNECVGVKKIVAMKEGPTGEKAIFNFQQLHSLWIWNMSQLDGFYAENHFLACPSLRILRVFNCAKLELFEIQGRSIQRTNLSTSMQQPLFIVEEVIPSLENLTLSSKDATMIWQDQQWRGHSRKLMILVLYNFTDKQSATFVESILQKAPNLATLVVQDSSLREIFQDGRLASKEGKNEKSAQLKKLTLLRLEELQYICRAGCQIHPILEVLEVLYVKECASLKILVPPSITFSHMTYLEVRKSDGLINLIYSSTARSFVKLETMKIIGCNSLEEIVIQEVTETQDEVVFTCLKTIELECLPRLNSFSSRKCLFKFPLLKRVVVRECPRMKIFCSGETSAPMLRKVIKEGKDEEWCWEGDLNGTLKKICLDKVPFLEHLDLSLYPELKDSWYNPIGNKMFCNLKYLVVQKCDFLSNVLIYSNSLRALCNLEELKVRDCESLEVVFEFNTTNGGGMSEEESINLRKISLFNLPKLQHIWRQDCEEVVSSADPLDSIFQGLKVSKELDNGEKGEEKQVEIQHQQPLFSAAKVLFPNLETIVLKEMPELKTLWRPFFTSNSISSLKTMEVSDCEKLENIFPSYMQRTFTSLKKLMVSDCKSIQVIFDFSSETDSAEDTTSLLTLTLLRLSELKQIWSKDPKANHRFHNLKHVCVEDCENLEYLLPFSIATHAIQLEDITIKKAGRMKQIVPDKEATMDNPVKFEFNHLKSLVLWNLNELEQFFAGKHSLRCPLLRKLDVYNCAKLKVFKTRDLSSHGRVSDNELIQISMQQPLFTLEEVFCNLENLTLNSEDASIISHGQFSGEQLCKLKCLYLIKFEDDQAAFPYWFLQNLTNLEELFVEMSSFKEVFQEERSMNEKQIEIKTRVKQLTLNELNELQHICKEGLQIDPVLEVLEYLKVDQCSNLKHLVPSSVNFSHLTDLEVQNCSGLTHFFTSTTARSLVKLTTIKIRGCNSLEHVVAKEREEAEDEIAFNSLEILEFERLPMIKRFCSTNCFLSLPLLENVVVKQCPRMKIFSVGDTSTLKLEKIISEEDEKLYWEGDINRTINKMFVEKVAFRSFKHLELSQYPELKNLWYSPIQQDVFGNLKYLVVQKCEFLSNVLMPINLLQALSNLEDLQVSECGSLEAVFDLRNMNEKEMLAKETIHLKTINLSCLPELKYIWKQHSQKIVSFDNLGEISFENTQGLKISKIQGFSETKEEDEGDIEHQQPASSIEQVLFPNFERLKTMEVSNCKQLETIFPSHMKRAFASLETLMVSDCNSVKVIFELSSEVAIAEDTTRLRKLTLLRLSKLQQIWSRDPQANLCFHNLQLVCVEDCKNLEYLLPFSIAMHAIQLEDITIKQAGGMKQIVSDQEETVDSPLKFEFNSLTALVLWDLHELEGFFARKHSLSCPSLRELDVFNCTKLQLFKMQYSSSQGRVFDNKLIQFSMQQPFFTLEEVFCNLEKLTLNSEDASIISQGQFSGEHLCKLKCLYLTKFEDDEATFPYWSLQNSTNLEELFVEMSSFKELFQEERPINEKQVEIKTRVKRLTLNELNELQHICKEGLQIDPILKVLEYLKVDQCSNLKYLVPFSVTFNHLTYLEVQNCNGLTHLITSTTARSLVKLTTMKIRDCNSLEHVVAKEREEPEDQIPFNSLEILELECLQKLKMFCSTNCFLNLPLLEKLLLRQCPRMKSFSARDTSAPMLLQILTDEQGGKWCWEGDLNTTVNKMFKDMVAFSSFNHLELSDYPELIEVWHGHVDQKIFCNLKHLVVRKCTFFSNIIFSSNLLQLLNTLEDLEVTECDSLEAVFDVKVLDDKAMHSKEVSGLKKLTLSNLPNLRYIWNKDLPETLSLEHLQVVEVSNCQNLKNIFWVSLCHDLRQLEEIDIEYCGVEEIVAIEEGSEELNFDFPQLKKLRLAFLMQLTDFYPKRYTLECPSLKILNVARCEALQIFDFGHVNLQQLRVGDVDLPIHQPLFYIEKVSENLEELSLNGKDAERILKGNYEINFFQSIEFLRLQYFQETPIMFLNDLLKRFPDTTMLQARYSSLETLFPSEEIGYCSISGPMQIKTLWLFQLEQLKHIWNDDSMSDPLVQSLEYFYIMECSRLRRLAPPSISFRNLTNLKVEDCNGLIYLVTFSTTKSLVHLTSLTVKNCEMLEEVVKVGEEESEEEIRFQSLKDLELTCLSSFKSFCCGKHTFIFPSLVTFKVTRCHKMQNFSSGIIIAPFLKKVKVENEKIRWKEDLNTTIKQLFMDKAIRGEEGNKKQPSSNIAKSTQTHQWTMIPEASSSEGQPKANQIVDASKQEIHKLPIPDTGIDTQMMRQITETSLDQASQKTLGLTKVDTVMETREMHETTKGDSVKAAQNIPSFTFVQDAALKTQEMHETAQRSLVQATEIAPGPTTVYGADNCFKTRKKTSKRTIISRWKEYTATFMNNEATGSIEMNETIQTPLVQAVENTLCPTSAQEKAIDPTPSQALEHMSLSIQDQALANQKVYEIVERSLVQAVKIALSPTTVSRADESPDLGIHPSENLFVHTTTDDDKEKESHDSKTQPSQNLFNQTTSTVIAGKNETIEAQAMHEANDRPLIQTDQDAVNLDTTQNIGTQEMYDIIESFLAQFAQNTMSLPTTQHADESQDMEIYSAIGTQDHMYEVISRPLIQIDQNAVSFVTIQNTEPQEIYETIERPLAQLAEATQSLPTIQDAGSNDSEKSNDPEVLSEKNLSSQGTNYVIAENRATTDPPPLLVPEPLTSSVPASHAYNDYKGMIDMSVRNSPYLEAGVKRHPQVHDWLNTQGQGVFSFLFAEVTRILRTTRRGDLTDNDRKHIRKCSAALEAVGFDHSWLSYVYGCVEECSNKEDLKRKLEEARGIASSLKVEIEEVESKASNLKKDLASVEASLVLLDEEASRIDNFIE